MDAKECTKCGDEKNLNEFPNKKRGKYGKAAQCKACTNLANSERYKNGGKQRWANARKEWQSNNPDKNLSYQRKYRSENKEKVAASHKTWAQKNADLRAASAMRRHTAKLQRRPSWASEQLIDAFHSEARRLEELTGIKFHVYHIIPMQGELVSGLDVETNLQLLPAHENRAKHNHFDPMTFCA